MKRFIFLAFLFFLFSGCWAQGVPEYFIVRGQLVNKALQAREGLYDFRVSLWDSADLQENDDPESHWFETHTLEISESGQFEIRVGTLEPLPADFNFDDYAYLQLEAKDSLLGDFFVLDPRRFDESIDRIELVTVPFKPGKTNIVSGSGIDVMALDQTLSSYESQIAENTAGISNLTQNITENQTLISSLKQEDVQLSNRITQLVSQVEILESAENGDFDQHIAALESATEQALQKLSGVQTTLASLGEKDLQFQNSITGIETDIQNLQTDSVAAQTQIQTLRSDFKKENTQLGNAIAEVGTNVQTLQSNLVSTKSDVFALRSDLENLEEDQADSLWQDSVQTRFDLPGNTQTGEVRYVVSDQTLRLFDGQDWQSVGGGESNNLMQNSYTYSEILNLHSDLAATPGVFYWDRNNKEYFVGQADGSLRSLFGTVNLPRVQQSTSWHDFRFVDIGTYRFEKTSTLVTRMDNQLGLRLSSNRRFVWNEGAAFPQYSFDRADEKTVEFVFFSGEMDGRVMMGVTDTETDVNNLRNRGFQKQEIALYMQSGTRSNMMYGRTKKGSRWYKMLRPTPLWRKNTFYRVRFPMGRDGGLRGNFVVDEVAPENFDRVVKNVANVSLDNTANSQKLKPFWLVSGATDYRLVALRVK